MNVHARPIVAILALLLAVFIAPALSTPPAMAQQISSGIPVAICGAVASITLPTGTQAGSISFSNVSANITYTIPASTTVGGVTGVATGSNVCLVGVANVSGQLLSGTIIPNASSSVTVCGPVSAYTPATLSSLGSLTIGGSVIPLGPNTTFTGATPASGSNLCIALNVNSLGIGTGGVVSANSGGTSGSTLVQLCGGVAGFTAPTMAAAGSLTFSAQNVTAQYAIAAGTTVSGATGLTTGSNVCLVGVANAAGVLTSASLIPNIATEVQICGPITAYTPATVSTAGALTIGGILVPLGYGTAFSGQNVGTGSSLCISFTLNSLGRAISGAASVPLAATLYIPDSGANRSHHGWMENPL